MSWDASEERAARVLSKAAPFLDFDPSAFMDPDDVPELTKAVGKLKGVVLKSLWVWDFYKMQAASTAADLAALEDSAPEAVATAFLRSLLSES